MTEHDLPQLPESAMLDQFSGAGAYTADQMAAAIRERDELKERLERAQELSSLAGLAAEQLKRERDEARDKLELVRAMVDEFSRTPHVLATSLRVEFDMPELCAPSPQDINVVDWKGVDGASAFHMIDRQAENWLHVGRLMTAWRDANQKEKDQ